MESPSRPTGEKSLDPGVRRDDGAGVRRDDGAGVSRDDGAGVRRDDGRRQGAVARLVVGLLALAIAGGTFYITSGLSLGWRIALAIIVAAPLLLLVDLLRDSAGGYPRAPDDRQRGIDGNARRTTGTAQDSQREDT